MINYHQPFVLLENRVWRTYRGGKLLDEWVGREPAVDGHFPEDWVGSATRADNPGREDLADEGIGSARGADGRIYSMEELYASNPERALGADHVRTFGPRPHLLVKLLDSAMRLHIQAHPTASWARQHLDAGSGKAEAWWILKTRSKDAYVYLGFQHPPTPEAWKRMVEAQDIEAIRACFEPISVEAGDVLLVEGGLPHAIGPGIAMIEVQEPTDYVVRCEFSHGGFDLPESARTMGMGMDRVLDMFDYTAYPADRVKERFGPRSTTVHTSAEGSEVALLSLPQTDRFEVRRIEARAEFELTMDGRFSILIVTAGGGVLRGNGVEVDVEPWTRVFLPSALETVILRGEISGVRCLPPIATSHDR